MNAETLIVGKINGFHGVKGCVKVFSETRPRNSILQYKRFLLDNNQTIISMVVEDSWENAKNIILKFKDYDDRSAVEPLLGAIIHIYQSQLPVLSDDEFYWQELINMSVVDMAGSLLGTVDSLFETGANDVMVVKTGQGAEILIPFTMGHAVRKVDKVSKVVFVDWDIDDF